MDSTSVTEQPSRRLSRADWIWLAFIAGLAALPPVRELHKQEILAGIAVFQIFESRLIARLRHGRSLAVLVKTAFAALLLAHTPIVPNDLPIESAYYQIFYVPVITAALYFGPLATIAWTALASGAYAAYLIPALRQETISSNGAAELAIRALFFFLVALIVNRAAMETRRQRDLYRLTAASLEVSNRELQKAQDEARRSERLAALGQMSAGLAHEIRNPLGVIKGSAEMLQRKIDPANALAVELAGNISGEVNRLNELVARFLDFARPLRVELRLQSLQPLISRVIREVQERRPDDKVRVTLDAPPGVPDVPLDEALAERVLYNLIHNAFDAMTPGGGVLNISLGNVTLDERNGVEVVLQDTGNGVPAGLHESIFNPFVTTKETGVGLGLSVVSKIVDAHHGRLRLDPGSSPGACFRVFFPTEG